jgi:osmotically-inducible protein OsmY
MSSLQALPETVAQQDRLSSYSERSEYLATVMPLFATIPPERVGLNGEYDHSGLAKRVALAFQENVAAEEIANLRVTQRGRVVILMGEIANKRLLSRLISLAMQVDGATGVETSGVITHEKLNQSATKLAS